MDSKITTLKFGFYSSLALTLLTMVTFGFSMMAIPPSGPYCPGNCMNYPFSELLNYYPRDYYWMYLAIFQIFAFIIFSISLHYHNSNNKKIFSSMGVAFTLIASIVLLSDYFMQFAVVPISMMKGETEGIALLTQYNGNGIFIALEELGYIAMSVAFIFFASVFASLNRLNKTIRILLFLPLVLNIVSFVIYSLQFGIDRSYRFEVAAISIDWFFLIIIGCLTSIYFKKQIQELEV